MRGWPIQKYYLHCRNPASNWHGPHHQPSKRPTTVLLTPTYTTRSPAIGQLHSACLSCSPSTRSRLGCCGSSNYARVRYGNRAQLKLSTSAHGSSEETVNGKVAHGVGHKVAESEQSNNLVTHAANEPPAERLQAIANTEGKPLEQLLDLVVKICPPAIPTVRVQESIRQVAENQAEDAEPTIRIEVVHEEYGILCGRTVTRSEQSQASLQLNLEALINEYLRKVIDFLQLNDTANQDPKSYPIRALYSTLELDQISADVSTISIDRAHARNLSLSQVQVYAGKERLGQPQVWTDRVIAWRLARASADAEVLKRAEQAGLDLAALSLASTTGPPARKKKENILELPRAKSRDKPRVYSASISEGCLTAMLHTLRDLYRAGLPNEIEPKPFKPLPLAGGKKVWTADAMTERSADLGSSSKNKKIHPGRKEILVERDKLPIRQPSTVDKICHLVEENDVVVFVSETGSGKTTQLPQILLEKAFASGTGGFCNIVCTQPRRIAATSVAARVARERGTYVGGSVGYHVRFHCKSAEQPGSIDYWTAGILLKRLQDESEQILSQISHIVVDEIHERDLTVDLLLSVLRDLMRSRKGEGKSFPKLILMSATMKTIDFERYFAQSNDRYLPRVTSITIPGRAYPVTTYMLDEFLPLFTHLYANDAKMMSLLRHSQSYLEWEDEYAEKAEEVQDALLQNSMDNAIQGINTALLNQNDPFRDSCVPYSLMVLIVAHVLTLGEKGDILVFLPGMREIDVFADMLESKLPSSFGFGDPDKLRLFKLHSALYQTNAQVFEPIPRECQRIILATNIAQTSITLPNVVHVIDSGKRRAIAYDQVGRRNDFTSAWIDKATSFQRKGRAGRVRSGYYWAMFTEARFQAMPEKARPDILVSDLTTSSLVLKSYSNGLDLQEFFAETLDAPNANAVATCITELQGLGMLTHNEEITPLGKFCADLPLHPAKARGLLLGALFGCLKPMLILASHDPNAPLIHSPTSRKDVYQSTLSFVNVADDDRYATVKAFLEYDEALMDGSDEKIAALEHRNVQRSAYRDILITAFQLYEVMADYRILPLETPAKNENTPNIFRFIPDSLDQNGDRINLFKALGLGVVDTNLAVWDQKEESWLVKDIKCMLRPYSVNTMQSLKLLQRYHYREQGEIVAFNEMVRNVVSSPRPFLVETSTITPLMAMLFGGPIALVDEKTIEINGWLRYKVQVSSSQVKANNKDPQTSPARVIFEFRKAIDRYMVLAFSDLVNVSRLNKANKRMKKINRQFRSTPLRDAMTTGLIRVLDLDAEHWDEQILLR